MTTVSASYTHNRTVPTATVGQVDELLGWAKPLGDRTWAVESAGGLGYLLSQQLVAAGEAVVHSDADRDCAEHLNPVWELAW